MFVARILTSMFYCCHDCYYRGFVVKFLVIAVIIVITVVLITATILFIAIIVSILNMSSTPMPCKIPWRIKQSFVTGLDNYQVNVPIFLTYP